MKNSFAEFIGTFALVFFGCGTAVIGGMGSGATAVNLLGIASAFGFAIVAMAYGIGPISGCHVNPAVSFGVFVAGRMRADEMIRYWIAQVLGAIAGAIVLYIILSGKAQGWTGSLGQNGWGAGYNGEYNVLAAFVFEVVATFFFSGHDPRRHAPVHARRLRRPCHRADARRHPPRRHQHHRNLGQPSTFNRTSASWRRLRSAGSPAACRPANRRRRGGSPFQGERVARRSKAIATVGQYLSLSRSLVAVCAR